MRQCFIILFVFTPLFIFAQDYYATYEELMASGELQKIPALFDLWETEAPDDENLYITGFNHFLTFSREEQLIMPVSLDSAEKEETTYISSEIIYNDSIFNISQTYIQKAINANPKRLDFHFGKIHALWLKGEHRQQTSEILGIIEIGKKINHDWLWTENKRPEDQKGLFTSSIYEYVANLYGADQYVYVRQISESMIKAFPKEIASYSNLGAVYLLDANYKKALKYFKKAHKLDKKDIIVLSNMGNTYDLKGKYAKAIKYYKLIQLYGDDNEKKFAQEKIENIRLRMSAM